MMTLVMTWGLDDGSYEVQVESFEQALAIAREEEADDYFILDEDGYYCDAFDEYCEEH